LVFKFIQGFWIQNQRIQNIFKNKFELGSHLDKPKCTFEYFLNLEVFKISLNIEIQTKALNGGLLK
jgi:hypothetical protein